MSAPSPEIRPSLSPRPPSAPSHAQAAALSTDPLPVQHLVIPGAGLPAAIHPGSQPTTPPPALPNLQRLMQHMVLSDVITCDDTSPCMPYELLLAQLNGLPTQPPGCVPWAAFESGTTGTPCAWVKPCHWQVGADHVLLGDPSQLHLDEATSRALLAAAAPYFLEDGITLSYMLPTAWLAMGEVFRHLPTRSLERVLGQRITPAVFDATTAAGTVLRRLQNEMQMLFYTHPANDVRQERGLPPVNSFWITGAGVLAQPVTPVSGVVVETRLQAPDLQHDEAAHANMWQQVDTDVCAALLARLKAGQAVRLSLCGHTLARTYNVAPPSLTRRIKRLFGLQPSSPLLSQL